MDVSFGIDLLSILLQDDSFQSVWGPLQTYSFSGVPRLCKSIGKETGKQDTPEDRRDVLQHMVTYSWECQPAPQEPLNI